MYIIHTHIHDLRSLIRKWKWERLPVFDGPEQEPPGSYMTYILPRLYLSISDSLIQTLELQRQWDAVGKHCFQSASD